MPYSTPASRRAELESRRRTALLAGLLVASMIPVATGASTAWPLLGIPVLLAYPLCGPAALTVVASVVALVMSVLSGRPEVEGHSVIVAFAMFVILGMLAGWRHTNLQDSLERESERSMTDSLTGLPNYSYLSEALPLEIHRSDRTGHSLSLVLLDLDGFKAFNDLHGHEVGNRMLVAVGRAMMDTARSSDIIGRFGGEEFALIVQGNADEATEAAERLRQGISEVRIDSPQHGKVGVTISAGVAERHPGEGVEALITRADQALYAAKDAGRNRVHQALSDELSERRRAA